VPAVDHGQPRHEGGGEDRDQTEHEPEGRGHVDVDPGPADETGDGDADHAQKRREGVLVALGQRVEHEERADQTAQERQAGEQGAEAPEHRREGAHAAAEVPVPRVGVFAGLVEPNEKRCQQETGEDHPEPDGSEHVLEPVLLLGRDLLGVDRVGVEGRVVVGDGGVGHFLTSSVGTPRTRVRFTVPLSAVCPVVVRAARQFTMDELTCYP
jgi:hypothetical protein